MRNFIDSFQHKNVASYFVCGNALATGYPEHWINILGGRIARVAPPATDGGIAEVVGKVGMSPTRSGGRRGDDLDESRHQR